MMRLIALIVSLLVSASASAYEMTGFVWRLPVPYQVNAASAAELGAETALSVVAQSYDAWKNPACSGVVTDFRGETAPTQAHYSGDGLNTLLWYYRPNQRPPELGGAETIGVTLSLSQGRQAVDGDILFNGYDHRWTTNATTYGEVDAQAIVTHEVGHQFGLNHSPFQRATMYAAYLGGSGARTLDRDDVDGICALYPSGTEAACRLDADCPGNDSCIGGECINQPIEAAGELGDDCGPQQACGAGLACAFSRPNAGFCTRECDDDCPRGLRCEVVAVRDGNVRICMPEQNMPIGTAAFGDSCDGPNDCGSGFCVGFEGGGFCSQACVSGSDCPDSSSCAPLQGGGGACLPNTAVPEAQPECFEDQHCGPGFFCTPEGTCVQREAGALGALCGNSMPCASELLCVTPGDRDPYCTRACNDGCPSAWRCETVLLDGQESSICLPGGGLLTAPASGAAVPGDSSSMADDSNTAGTATPLPTLPTGDGSGPMEPPNQGVGAAPPPAPPSMPLQDQSLSGASGVLPMGDGDFESPAAPGSGDSGGCAIALNTSSTGAPLAMWICLWTITRLARRRRRWYKAS